MTGPRPLYSAEQAVARALAMVGRGSYRMGTGNISSHGDDERDCFGFAVCEAYGIKRHRPGFNVGSWATVSDDLNCDSAIEDADHHGELFERVFTPFPGALLTYPTTAERIGHIGIVVSVSRCIEWDHDHPRYALLDVVQCRPNAGIVATDGSLWDRHRTVMLRVLP